MPLAGAWCDQEVEAGCRAASIQRNENPTGCNPWVGEEGRWLFHKKGSENRRASNRRLADRAMGVSAYLAMRGGLSRYRQHRSTATSGPMTVVEYQRNARRPRLSEQGLKVVQAALGLIHRAALDAEDDVARCLAADGDDLAPVDHAVAAGAADRRAGHLAALAGRPGSRRCPWRAGGPGGPTTRSSQAYGSWPHR